MIYGLQSAIKNAHGKGNKVLYSFTVEVHYLPIQGYIFSKFSCDSEQGIINLYFASSYTNVKLIVSFRKLCETAKHLFRYDYLNLR